MVRSDDPRYTTALVRERIERSARGWEHLGPYTLLEETASTQDDLRAMAEDGAPAGSLVITEHQSSGRGRRGRTWSSRPHRDILFSLLLRPTVAPARWGAFPFHFGLAVAASLDPPRERATVSGRAQLKWPNDLFLAGRKIGGILAESSQPAGGQGGYLILGLGLNVNRGPEDFNPEIRELATSLAEQGGMPLDRTNLLLDVLISIDMALSSWEQGPVPADAWNRRATWRGDEVQLQQDDEVHSGTFLGVRADGAAVIRGAEGRPKAFHHGDLSLLTAAT